jgi:uncharacterized protein (TIGR03437 family)
VDLSFLLLLTLAQVNVLTYQYDNTRAGANRQETVLTPANVNSSQFGKLISYPVDGLVYAQPLYAANLAVNGSTRNVVFVATEHDSVYAFDADGKSASPLWHVNFLINGATTVPAADTSCDQIAPEIGITGTPVIDPATNTIYLSAMTKENGNYFHRLHALDITTGAERPGSPVVIQATMPGTGEGGSTVGLIPRNYKQRPGLLLLNGTVYVGMSSHCDGFVYHGWLLGYDKTTLQQTVMFNTTPNGTEASFWNGGAAPAVDSAGNIYVVSANGTFDADQGGVDYGDSVIKLTPNLRVLDYFTPFDVQKLNNDDTDLGSGGVALIGDEAGSPAHPHLMTGAGKEGRVYLIDRDNLGKFQNGSDSQIVQSIPNAVKSLYGNPAYFNQTVFYCGVGDQLRAFPISNAALGTPATSTITFDYPGCVPSISSNGTSNGVVWTLDYSRTLRAFDASNVANQLYNSNQNSDRDVLDSYVRFSVPTVANGKVYAGTQTSLTVYGLLNPASTLNVSNAASGQTGIAAPGGLIAIKGLNLGGSDTSAGGFPLPMTLNNASANVGGAAAPMLFASSAQINAQVPFEVPNGGAAVTVMKNGATVGSVQIAIQDVSPGIFTPVPGRAAAINPDGSVNSPSAPAPSGSFIAIYMTGLGRVDHAVASGTAAPALPLSRVNANATATIGGRNAQVLFAGLTPGFAGLYQVNLAIPQLAPGDYPVQVTANGVASNTATISVR